MNRRNHLIVLMVFITIIGVMVFITPILITAAQDVKEARLRLTLDNRITRPFEIGDKVELNLTLSYQKLKPRSRIYVHLLPVRGNRWVTAGEGLFSVKDPEFAFTGGIRDGDKGMFNFSNYNYPISLLLKNKILEVLFKGFGLPQQSIPKLVEAVATNEKGYDLDLAFLASNGQKTSGFERVKLGFEVPDYPHCYDGIAIALFIMYYNKENKASLFTKTKNMPGVRIPVKPYQPCPEKKEDKKKIKSEDISGKLRISAFYPSNAILYTGTSNTLKVKCSFTDLEKNSAVYIAFLPSTERDKFLFGKYLLTLPGYKGLLVPTFFNSTSDFLRIPQEDEPIQVHFTHGQTLEAALVGTVKRGGSGSVTGNITFTPPPYATRYRRVFLMPMILVPTQSGPRVLIDSDRIEGSYVSVSEN